MGISPRPLMEIRRRREVQLGFCLRKRLLGESASSCNTFERINNLFSPVCNARVKGSRRETQLIMKAFIEHTPSGRKAALRALVDSGCSRMCLNIVWAKKMRWPVYKLKTSVKLVYADGRESSESTLVTRFRVTVHGRAVELYALITQLGSADLYLGFDGLGEVNQQIDWKTLDIRINVLMTTPIYEAEFPKVFSEADFERLPPRREWDHAIELIEGSKLPKGKCYGIKAVERDALKSFVETNLKSKRIRLSKSPYASPFFFADKPGSTRRWVCLSRWLCSSDSETPRQPFNG